MKVCTKCGELKPLEMFHKGIGAMGHKPRCKPCRRADAHAYRLLNTEFIKARQDKYLREHAELHKASCKKWEQRNRSKRRGYLSAYRARRYDATVGDVPSDLWDVLIEMYGPHCMVSNCIKEDLSLDHIVPLNRGGTHSMDNFQILCKSHNSSKGDRNCTDYRPIEVNENSDI
jgi:5-methylcytosine-specific restriction endonuclease McrA